MQTDPVCKMAVDPKTAPARAEYEGETYYFCHPACKTAFEDNPEEHLASNTLDSSNRHCH